MTKPTLTTTVISDLAWEQLTNMDAPANSPIASTVAGVAPVQSWEETDQVLPDIGQVDNELLAAAGLSNTILISVKTEEVLKTITVSIGANGNWFVGGEDTGVAAKGTDEATIARPTGVYGVASVFHVGNTLTIGAGLMYCVKEGQNFFTMQTTAELNISVDASTTFVTIDRTGTVRTYSSGINLWTIPESQALVALVIDTDGTVSSFAVPTVHNAMLMASAVIPYSRGAIEAASTATLQATIASQFASQAHQSAVAAEEAKTVTQADAAITTTNAQLAEQYKTDAQTAATSAHQFADFADADRVATAADRAQVATDKAAVAADRSTVATDKGIVASDKAITLGYKNDAAASKNLAAEYAIKPENSVITGTVSDYSALHWAQKAQQWAQAVSSALVWKGQWSAASNTAPPTPAVGTGAHFYRISAAGTINSVTYEVGDYIHWDTVSLSWFKIDGTDAVMTVNGVSPVGGNVSITTITGNAATATKLATARLIAGKSFDGTANITFAASDVGAEQAGVAATLINTHAATADVHAISAINGLQAALAAKYSPSNKPAPADIGAAAVDSVGIQIPATNTGNGMSTGGTIKNQLDSGGEVTSWMTNKPTTGGHLAIGISSLKGPVYWDGVGVRPILAYDQAGTVQLTGLSGYPAVDVSPTKIGEGSGLLKGAVEGGMWTGWRSRAAAVMLSCPNADSSAHSVWKATKWGSSHLAAMDVHSPGEATTSCIVTLHAGTDTTFQFNANGVLSAGDVYIRSDARLKSNYEDIVNPLDIVAGLKGYIYDKRVTAKADYSVREAGLIAQDVEKVFPIAVRQDSQGTKTVTTYGLIAVLVEAVNALRAELAELRG